MKEFATKWVIGVLFIGCGYFLASPEPSLFIPFALLGWIGIFCLI